MRTIVTLQGSLEVPVFDQENYDFTSDMPVKVVPYNEPGRSLWQRAKDLFKRTRYVLTDHWYTRLRLDAIFPDKFERETTVILWLPKGFYTDFSSIPRALINLPGFSPTGPTGRGSGIHDFSYRCGCLLNEKGDLLLDGADRKIFDSIMLYINKQRSGYPKIAKAAYSALRLFGWAAWLGARKNNPAGLIDLHGEYVKNG